MSGQQSGVAAIVAFWRKPLLIAVSLAALTVPVLPIALAGPAAAQQNCNTPLGWWESKNLDPFFLNPNGPSPTTACDFELWSWSAFVHWMQRDPKTGLPMFLLLPTYNDLKPDGSPPTTLQAASLVHQRPLILLPRNAQPQSLGSFEQAGPGGVLVDQAGRAVYYTTHMDPIYFAFTQKYFGPKNYPKASPTLDYPIGATVMKSSWRIVRAGRGYEQALHHHRHRAEAGQCRRRQAEDQRPDRNRHRGADRRPHGRRHQGPSGVRVGRPSNCRAAHPTCRPAWIRIRRTR